MKTIVSLILIMIVGFPLGAQESENSEAAPTQEDYRLRKEKLKSSHENVKKLREEVSNAKESGDAEALKKKQEALEAAKKERREAYDYVTNNSRNQRRKRIKAYRETKKEIQEEMSEDEEGSE